MAKINFSFDSLTYAIDESALDATKNDLKSHFSFIMNGSGSAIKFDQLTYNIDTKKLNNTASEIASCVANSFSDTGRKLRIGKLEYYIDSKEIDEVISVLQANFYSLANGITETFGSLLDEGLLDEFILE